MTDILLTQQADHVCMTYRPWQTTGRPMCDLETLRDRQTFAHDIQTMENDRQTYVLLRGTWDIKLINLHDFDMF